MVSRVQSRSGGVISVPVRDLVMIVLLVAVGIALFDLLLSLLYTVRASFDVFFNLV